MSDHRRAHRVPLKIWLNKILGDDLFMCSTSDISREGIYLNKLIEPQYLGRRVGLEFQLPGTRDVIWAVGEIVREVQRGVEGSGIRFTHMAGCDQATVERWLGGAGLGPGPGEAREREVEDPR